MLYAPEMKRLDDIQLDALGDATQTRAMRVSIICEAERLRTMFYKFEWKMQGKIASLASDLYSNKFKV